MCVFFVFRDFTPWKLLPKWRPRPPLQECLHSLRTLRSVPRSCSLERTHGLSVFGNIKALITSHFFLNTVYQLPNGLVIASLENYGPASRIGLFIKAGSRGRLGGSVGWAAAFSSGHDLRVLGSSSHGALCSAGSLLPSLSLCLPLCLLVISLYQINK